MGTSIHQRFLIIIGLALIALVAVFTVNAVDEKATLLAERKLKTRHLVEAPVGAVLRQAHSGALLPTSLPAPATEPS